MTRPEIYFGELTNTDVYVKTRQKEFNYPQGETNSLTSYEGNGGIVLGGFFRRLIIALDRGDLAKLPFSDDVTPESRLLMRRNIRERVATLAPFLTFDEDPYIVVGDDGRLSWMMDGFTTSESLSRTRGTSGSDASASTTCATASRRSSTPTTAPTTFYVFDAEDPIIAAYRGVFPSLFKDGSAMPPAHAQARALSRAAAAAAGGGLRAVPHDRSRRVLQPRGSVERRDAKSARPASASRRRRRWSRTSC